MHFRSFAQSILFRLILVGLCLIFLGSSIRYLIFSDFLQKDLTKVVAGQQMTMASYAAQDIGHKILVRQARLQQLGTELPSPAFVRPNQPAPAFSASAPLEALFSGGMLLIAADGRVLLDTTAFEWSGQPFQFVPKAALRANTSASIHTGTPALVSSSQGPVLPMTLVLQDGNGPPWGYLIGFTFLYGPDFLGNLLQARLGQSGSGFLLISPQDQLFVAASNPEKVLTRTPAPGINLLHDKAMQGYRGTGITTNAYGVEEISAIVSVPGTNWFLVSGIATSEALGTIERLKSNMVRNTLLTIVFLFISLSIVTPLILRPLTRATRQAEKMSRGQAPLAPLKDAGNGEVGTLIKAFNRLLSKLHDQQVELSKAAFHDSLTGLPNRRKLADRLQNALTLATRNQQALALLFIDLDQFKPINDTFGHEAGDAVLQTVAQRLSNQLRASDCVARLGGDEFVILLTNLKGPNARNEVEKIAINLMNALKQPFDVAGTPYELGLSIGGVISNGADSAADLMHQADQLMYKAKAEKSSGCIIEQAHERPMPAYEGCQKR